MKRRRKGNIKREKKNKIKTKGEIKRRMREIRKQ